MYFAPQIAKPLLYATACHIMLCAVAQCDVVERASVCGMWCVLLRYDMAAHALLWRVPLCCAAVWYGGDIRCTDVPRRDGLR